MLRGNTDFVRLLLDQDYGGDLDFEKFLTIRRLYELYDAIVSVKT